MGYHEAVLLDESIAGLSIQPNGIYVDVTFGGGGHSKSILQKLENGKIQKTHCALFVTQKVALT